MTAPLSRYLTQFSTPPLARIAEVSLAFEPRISLTAEDLEMRLENAAVAARSEVEVRLRSETEARLAEQEAAAAQALESARSDWVSSQSEHLSKQVADAIDVLREMISEGLARALRPIAAQSLVERATREVAEALAKVLADPERPALSVRGPADLIAALRPRCEAASIDWIVTEDCEVTVLADATRLDTHLGTALAALTATEF